MSEEKNTDVPAVEETVQGTEESSVVEETPTTDDDKLDVADIMPSGKKNKDARDGLSRKEYAEMKSKEKNEEIDDLRKQLEEDREKLNAQLEQTQEILTQAQQDRAQQKFMSTLSEKGVDVKTFNSEYKEAYHEEYTQLVDGGLTPEKAADTALKMTLAVADNQARAAGRTSASLPPKSSNGSPVDDVPQISKDQFMNLLKDNINKYGQDEGMKKYEEYCDAQKAKGRELYSE